MHCASCGHENPAGSRFCLECGGSFGIRCGRCGAELPAAANFCNHCGQSTSPTAPETPDRDPRSYTPKHLVDKILQSKSALEGERKQVTVLFADVKGSMELAEELDPEEWHRILDRFFQVLADGVHRFEGTVNQYTGDGIMALFGAPIAHEDHAQRACYAALHLSEKLREYAQEVRRDRGLDFSVRMGINSGEVVVGKIGDDLRMDYTAQGATVNLASRMQQIAEAGGIYLTAPTAQRVEGYFALEDLGEFKVRGAAEPMRVFSLRGTGRLRTRFDVSRARGLSTFVGRDREMTALEAALAKAREGQAQAVGIVAEAGVGKSRLCFEFAERCRARGIEVYEGHCQAHGKMIPYLPILEFFRAYYGITEHDSDRAARDKIAGRLLQFGEEFRDTVALNFDFLGVGDPEKPAPRIDPEARQRQISAIMRRLYQLETERQPTVTLIEDLHWIDGSSDAVVEIIVNVIRGTRALVIFNFRTEYHAEWMGMSHYEQLPIPPLGREATEQLLMGLLGSDASLEGLAGHIQERTGGNPFFIEEVVQDLAESGVLEGLRGAYRLARPVEDIRVPTSVQALLAARIDRLAEREKHVLQTAAVVGKEFPETLLRTLSVLPEVELSAALSTLKRGEFIYEESLYPEVEYAFKHPLTQEVALGSLLSERRARIHAAVAQALQEQRADKLDENAALIAHHLEGAGELLEASDWQYRAAEWVGTSDPRQAVDQWNHVLDLLEKTPESEPAADLGIRTRRRILAYGWRLGMEDSEASRLFEEAKTLATRTGDLRSLALVTWGYSLPKIAAGDLRAFFDHATEALAIAQESDDDALALVLHFPVAYGNYELGNLEQAVAMARTVLENAAEGVGYDTQLLDLRPALFARMGASESLREMGRLDEARVHVEAVRGEAEALDDQEALASGYWLMGDLALGKGEPQSALAPMRKGFEIAERIGSPFHRVSAHRFLARGLLGVLQVDEAIEALERALRIARDHRAGINMTPLALADLSNALRSRGEAGEAVKRAEEAISFARESGQRIAEIHAQLALARALLAWDAAGERAAIESALDAASALVNATGAKLHGPAILEERARLASALGDRAGYRRQLEDARRLFTEMSATGHAERVTRELAS